MTVDDKKIDTPLTDLFKAQNCYRDSPESGVSFKNGGGFLKVGELTSAFWWSARILPNSIDTAEKNAFKGSCYGHVAVLGQFRG